MAEELEEKKELEEEESTEEEESKGGFLKLLMTLVIVVVILGALAGGAWLGYTMFFTGGEAAAGAGNDDGADEVELYDPENPPGVIEFGEPFLIRLRREEGIMRSDVYLKVNISLEVLDQETQQEMEKNKAIMSRISDTIISHLASKFPSEVENQKWSRLKSELMELINEQFPERYKIQRLNFKEFLTQPR